VLDTYGAELFGFLVYTMGNEGEAADVFSEVGENLWTALPTFEFRCSVRTWLYVIARHAVARFRRTPWNRGSRRQGESLVDAVARARTRTDAWLRTETKDRFRVLREALEPDDRELLALRVDRALPWEDVARVMLGDTTPSDAAVRTECDRLRKRYQLLKEDLRRRAREAGLVEA
jgi:RNA polymerase sigma-70 factor (ECF subfamily)